MACYLAGATLAPDVASVAYVFAWKLVKAPQAPRGARIHSESLRDMILPPTQNERDLEPDRVVEGIRQSDPSRSGFTSYRYAQWMNDGIDLLRRHVTARSRVWTLDWYNPFPFALRLPPPQRGALCLCHGFTVNEQHHPPPEVLLGDATLVMVPRHSASGRSLAFLERTYRSALERDFVPLDSSRRWTLYRRRSSPSDATPPH